MLVHRRSRLLACRGPVLSTLIATIQRYHVEQVLGQELVLKHRLLQDILLELVFSVYRCLAPLLISLRRSLPEIELREPRRLEVLPRQTCIIRLLFHLLLQL